MKRNVLLKLTALMVMIMTATIARSASINIPDFQINPGGEHTGYVSFDPGAQPMVSYQGFQFDMELPDGITVDLTNIQLQSGLAGFQVSSESYENGKRCRIVVYTDGNPVARMSNLLSIVFKADLNATPGVKTIAIGRLIFSSTLGQDIRGEDSTTKVTVLLPDITGVYVEIPDFEIDRSGSYTVPVSLNHEGQDMFEYKGFQFDLEVPEHITVETAVLSTTLQGFSLNYIKQSDRVYRFMGVSSSSLSTSDQLMQITFAADDTAQAGNFPLNVTEVEFSTALGQPITLELSQSTITINAPKPEISISLNESQLQLHPGDTFQLIATISPEEMAGLPVVWTTSVADVASVDNKGLVTAGNVGVTAVTATVEDASATCIVTVTEEEIDNPFNPDDIKVTLSDQYFIVESGTVVDMWAKVEGGNPEGWKYEWTLEGNTDVLSTTGELSITALNYDDEPLLQNYKLHLSNSYMADVMFDAEYTFTVEIWRKSEMNGNPDADNWYGNDNGTYVSALKIREGNELGMRVNQPFGGYQNEWEYLWSNPQGDEIGDGQEIWIPAELKPEVAEAAGDGQAISENVYTVELTNYGPDDSVWRQETLSTATVNVYKRPQAPTQLLRKGDGTSFTFVVMMTPLSNQEILDLGYRYVYGYTDASGVMHELETTELRYSHTTGEIYNNTSYKFWTYSLWNYEDGSVVSSGLRYLDGSEDYDFDASSFDGTRSAEVKDTVVGIYTTDGRYMGVDPNRLEPGIYIIRNTNTVKKIIKI